MQKVHQLLTITVFTVDNELVCSQINLGNDTHQSDAFLSGNAVIIERQLVYRPS